ncbi:MarR family winged helix-turn-helix transcriptional regulator [Galactobacter caseinivorans]|uniref:MarR family winged helix-turn-helix transcriptional regulator n=1 Tax=Galactobacter caseinivorans TaxID=2676123 RepID=UPI0011C3ABB7|nr:MarR family transcriptional regulator [Galactobacter caseinivorans]
MTETVPPAGEVIAALLGRMYVLNRIASSRTPGGHSPSFYRTLGLLADRGGRRIGDLAVAVHVSQPGMTKIVRALEADSLVSRAPDPADSRATLVSLTDLGRAEISRRGREVAEHLLPDFAPLTEGERRTLQDAVDILTRHMPGESTVPVEEQ